MNGGRPPIRPGSEAYRLTHNQPFWLTMRRWPSATIRAGMDTDMPLTMPDPIVVRFLMLIPYCAFLLE